MLRNEFIDYEYLPQIFKFKINNEKDVEFFILI